MLATAEEVEGGRPEGAQVDVDREGQPIKQEMRPCPLAGRRPARRTGSARVTRTRRSEARCRARRGAPSRPPRPRPPGAPRPPAEVGYTQWLRRRRISIPPRSRRARSAALARRPRPHVHIAGLDRRRPARSRPRGGGGEDGEERAEPEGHRHPAEGVRLEPVPAERPPHGRHHQRCQQDQPGRPEQRAAEPAPHPDHAGERGRGRSVRRQVATVSRASLAPMNPWASRKAA